MKKLTKIVATIGPASSSEVMIGQLIENGVDVFRFNFKHSTTDWHNLMIERVNKVANGLNRIVGTLIDLQGPEIRITMPKEEFVIKENEQIIFGQEAFSRTDKKGISITHPQIINQLEVGQRIMVDSGAFQFILERSGSKFYLRSLSRGLLKNKKSLTIPGSNFSFPVLVDRDFEGLRLAAKHEVDFVALSFVRSAQDIDMVRKEMKKYAVKAQIVAKIETQKAIDDLDNIINVSDGIMVARGDLGVEFPLEEIPYYQKLIIKKSIKKTKPVITATQMLQSMENHPNPTRAEISDIANATYDLTDAVMLSAETAVGNYPVESVRYMTKTVSFNEKKNLVDSRLRFNFDLNDFAEILSDAAYGLSLQARNNKEVISGFLVLTHDGKAARLLSRYRPLIPIFAFVQEKSICDNLSVSYGVSAFFQADEDLTRAVKTLIKNKLVIKGNSLIVLHGNNQDKPSEISTIKILKI